MGGFNGSGVYGRYYNWTNDANASIDISSSRMDTEDNGFATGLSNCICKDGQTTITANIPFNNKKITGLGAGTIATDAAQLAQAAKGSVNYAVDTGSANAIVLTMSPVNTALTDGQRVYFMAAANNSGATTLAVDGLGSTPALVTSNLSALVGGEIVVNGMYEAEWSATNSKWVLLNPSVVTTGQIKAGAVTEAKITLADNTTGNVSTSAHGFQPKATNAGTGVMLDSGAYGAVTEARQSLSDVTTGNVSTSAHGYAPKAPNDATKYLDGTGAYSVPATLTVVNPTAFNSAATYAVTGLPSGIKKLYIYFIGVTFNATSDILIQIGNATDTLKTSGYLTASTSMFGSTVGQTAYTAGWGIRSTTASTVMNGTMELSLSDSANNKWIGNGSFEWAAPANTVTAGSQVNMSAALDRFTITTAGGTATWTAGFIGYAYIK